MKKTIYAAGFLWITANVSAQVGVNTTAPKTTMDVSAKRDAGGTITDNTLTYGLQAPRLTLAELVLLPSYGVDQKGALIYITAFSGGGNTGQRSNIDAEGYYYFDGLPTNAKWQKVTASPSASNNIYTADGTLAANRTVTTGTNFLNFANGTSISTVGISNSATEGRLTARGSSRGSLGLSAGTSNLDIYQDSGSTANITTSNSSTGMSIATLNATPINFSTSNTSRMIITKEGNVGIDTSTPNSTLVVEGSYEGAYKEISTNTTLTISDQYINVTGTTDVTITLPDATVADSFSGRVYSIKNTSTGTVTIQGSAAAQLLRTANSSASNTITLNPGSSAKVIKNNNTTTANPLWEVFDQTTVASNSGQFQIGEIKTMRAVVSATSFITNGGSRNLMTGKAVGNTTTTNRQSAYELSTAAVQAKFITINGLRMDFLESGINNGSVSGKFFNTTASTVTYNISALSTNDANLNGANTNIVSGYYSHNIDGNDDMACADGGQIEYVNAMITFSNGEWYNCTWHATRDASNYYFYMTAQRLN